jgi:protein N-terminal amidase
LTDPLTYLPQGYNFKSLQDINPFLEPKGSGISALWARTVALKLNCVVTVGYAEKVDIKAKWPTSPEYYNSVIVVSGDGETIANYRKSFLYYTDETWALEGQDGFYDGFIPSLGTTAMGICKLPCFTSNAALSANESLGMDLKLVFRFKNTRPRTDS